ncbi:hypothetical protein [Streptomyces sp. DH24]|uniref:hypothetical protein n=1 Tax=Streptomyces sp. DH24 TaxID=3040123 RepID=UPI0024431E47|nr:hypothetical protein [Streptomyces sp. DH24]MDG9715458.1 hypothetical protein [Streptomyces sp. DH24]
MTTQGPGADRTPEEPEPTPPVPDEVWLKFLADSESAIRASAPREPSARERARARHRPLDAVDRAADGGTTEQDVRRQPPHRPADPETRPVGDVWQPEDPWAGPAWRELDGRARLRRVVRVIATAAAITLALGAWSLLSIGAGTPSGTPNGTTVEQLEGAPGGVPTATHASPGSVTATPSSSASAAG